MSKSKRSMDYVHHMIQAATDALGYVEGLSKADFEQDKRTQQAVVMNLLIIGEAATKLMNDAPDWVAQHSHIPWRSMRGMRNRIAHGYFDIDMDVVWETLESALPELLTQLVPIASADDEEIS
ncbi:DUF86 domain-containing protein [Neisseria sp. N95_16]|uniref:DUF86 domain-containing protein n=1 Tax=Neisseria brasiliensis TaxID=2666100 RepID=A0A7X2KXU8_9NEIS|nr:MULTISPECIES: DUF86 domain-containing protein [Neisseria]MRN38011.1 DUF86 domain-containing protein [Neisseria brasiliensis]PJO10865.1 DUF86 domain-containing protein [Neisseria sp. N95_16]